MKILFIITLQLSKNFFCLTPMRKSNIIKLDCVKFCFNRNSFEKKVKCNFFKYILTNSQGIKFADSKKIETSASNVVLSISFHLKLFSWIPYNITFNPLISKGILGLTLLQWFLYSFNKFGIPISSRLDYLLFSF